MTFLMLISIFLITGCGFKEIDQHNIDQVTDLLLIKKSDLANQLSKGYKYYKPRGVSLLDNKGYNEKLFAKGNVYYLYVDVISYYFQKELKYQFNDEAYFSKKLVYDNEGYLEINKINDKYFIEMMYNYAKIETFANKNDLTDTIINMCYILSSLTFNDNIIQLLFDDDVLNFDEQKIDIFNPKRTDGKFLDYISEYDVYEELEEDMISTDHNIVE